MTHPNLFPVDVTETLLALEGKDTETLARWDNILNEWEWPSDLPGKPNGYDDMVWWYGLDDERRGTLPTRHDYIYPIAKAIGSMIGEKDSLRWHHIHNLGRTNEQFELWWERARPNRLLLEEVE